MGATRCGAAPPRDFVGDPSSPATSDSCCYNRGAEPSRSLGQRGEAVAYQFSLENYNKSAIDGIIIVVVTTSAFSVQFLCLFLVSFGGSFMEGFIIGRSPFLNLELS